MFPILLQQLRRDRLTLPIWIAGTALLLTVTAASVVKLYGDDGGQILAVALATPALLALRGIPNGDSFGSLVHFQSFAFLAVTIGLMNTFLATRQGRADEDTGRRELIAASPAPRLAPPLATLVLGLLANTVFVGLATAGYVSAGLDAEGALVSATTLGVIGLAFLGLGMLAGELMPTSRAANGVGVAVVLGSYALRAAGDALGTPDIARLSLAPAWPSWISPIGWGQQTLAFTEDNWWPVAGIAGLAVAAAGSALVVHVRRELGASLLIERDGRASAGAGLGSPFGLAWRLQAPSLLAWTVASALLGLVMGSLVTAIANVNLNSPAIDAIMASLGHSQGDLADALIPAILILVGVLAAAAGAQAVLRMRDEESAGRTEELLATPVSRVGWVLAFAAVGALTVLVVLLATGLAAAAGFAVVGNPDAAGTSFGQALVQAPAALTFVGLAALLVGVVPRAAIALSWGVFALAVAFGLFGELLQLPDGFDKVSPFSNVPALPTDDWGPLVVLGAVAVALTVIAAWAFRRRDLVT